MVLKHKQTASRILATALAVAMIGCWPVLAFAEETVEPVAQPVPTTETTIAETDQTEATTSETDQAEADSVAVVESNQLGHWPCPTPSSKPNTGTTIELKKTVNLRSDTFVPNETFAFTLELGDAVDATETSQPILAGVEKGLKLDGDGTVAFSSDDSVHYPSTSLSKTFTMTVNPGVFPTVGTYHYILRETKGTYDGMVYDDVKRDVYIYFVNGKNNKPTYYSTVVMKNDSKTTEFVNDYTNTHNLTVTKTLSGNQAVMGAEFTFTVGVTGADGEKYLVRKGNSSEILDPSEASTIDVKLKNGESFTIYGLSPKDTYTVTEVGANTNGYTTTFDKVKANSVTGSISKDTTIACLNRREATIPGGLAADMLPYAGMVLLAVGCGIYLLRRKHEDEQ